MSDEKQLADALALVDELLRPWAAGAVLSRPGSDELLLHAPFQPAGRVAEWRVRRSALTRAEP